jgi:DNA-binding LacI/PurR family transcriptional regulator
MEAIGRVAVDLILAMIEGEQQSQACPRVELPPELVERASCAQVREEIVF